jgi:hypothetical protein
MQRSAVESRTVERSDRLQQESTDQGLNLLAEKAQTNSQVSEQPQPPNLIDQRDERPNNNHDSSGEIKVEPERRPNNNHDSSQEIRLEPERQPNNNHDSPQEIRLEPERQPNNNHDSSQEIKVEPERQPNNNHDSHKGPDYSDYVQQQREDASQGLEKRFNLQDLREPAWGLAKFAQTHVKDTWRSTVKDAKSIWKGIKSTAGMFVNIGKWAGIGVGGAAALGVGAAAAGVAAGVAAAGALPYAGYKAYKFVKEHREMKKDNQEMKKAMAQMRAELDILRASGARFQTVWI